MWDLDEVLRENHESSTLRANNEGDCLSITIERIILHLIDTRSQVFDKSTNSSGRTVLDVISHGFGRVRHEGLSKMRENHTRIFISGYA